ncbi:MAG: hypothetical protein JSU96_07255 [Acidobacteriota bacterium]|nr:MAG: hypothetical protein JSU96_07255 [Acidobacteriota bacterium]
MTSTKQLWKVSAAGNEEPVQITKTGAAFGRESADGRYVYYSTFRPGMENKYTGIWCIPVEGGEAEQVLDQDVEWLHWDLAGNRLYFATPVRGERFSFSFKDLRTGEQEEFFRLEGPYVLDSFGVQENEEWVYFAYGSSEESRDIMLVENFR